MLLLVRHLLLLTLPSLDIDTSLRISFAIKKSLKSLGNRSDCIELTEKRESIEVEGVIDSSKNIFKRRSGSQTHYH